MDFQASLTHLESASRILLASPAQVTKDERNEAERILLTFRESRNAFPFCKFILENCTSEIILFETAEVLRNNLKQNWSKIPPDEIVNLSNHLLNMLINNDGGVGTRNNLTYSVVRRLAGVIALIVKHQSLINNGTQRRDLVNFLVGNLGLSGSRFISSCALIDALLAEHQYVANTNDPSLTYDLHFAAKKDFENLELLQIFRSCLAFLREYNHDSPERSRYLDHILKILECILYWNFTKINLPKRLLSVIEMDSMPAFKPPQSWSDTIVEENFIQIFFEIHFKIRKDEDFVLRTVNLIIQIISIHGPLIQTKESRVAFLSRIIPSFTTLLEVGDHMPFEIFGLSDVIRKILLFHRAATLRTLEMPMLERFFKAIGAFSCNIIQQSALEESKASVDDRIFRDSLTRVLEAWMNILTDTENIPKEIIQPVMYQIFNTFLLAHISQPEGFRRNFENIDSDTDDTDDDDLQQFNDQLQAIGVIGRFILPHSVPYVTNLIQFKTQAFQNQIQLITSGNAVKDSLTNLYEDLHWTLIISGHILAFDALGETNLIPPEIIDFSMSVESSPQASQTAVENSLQLLPLPTEGDPIIKLVSCVFSLAELEHKLLESNLGELLSPELVSNVTWFLQRWSQTYFLLNEEYYGSISPYFIHIWGNTSPLISSIQNSLFRRIRGSLMKFTSEYDVMSNSINLLLALVESSKKAETAMLSSELKPLVLLTNQVGPGQYLMPNELYRKFVRAIITVGGFHENEEIRNQYWDQILLPLLTRFRNCISMTSAQKHRDDVRLEMACVLSGFIGTAMSLHSRIASTLFQKLREVIVQIGDILHTFHNYIDIVDLCLEFVTELAKRALSYLSHADSLTLYEAAMKMIKSYALHANGKISLNKKSDEEDSYNDLIHLIDMLICLLTKDFLDLSPEALSSEETVHQPTISACEVSLHGLGIILPLMNNELLQYPNLSLKYYRLIAFLSELHPDKIMQISPMMIKVLFESVNLGLQGTAIDTFGSCCEFITCLGIHISKNSLQQLPASEYCKPFLQIFLEMILSQKVNKDAIPHISSALFACISAFQESFQELANQLISSRTCDESRTTMQEAFNNLTVNLNLANGGDRISRTNFRERLETFIFTARGCLD